jgi:hypothetical protein
MPLSWDVMTVTGLCRWIAQMEATQGACMYVGAAAKGVKRRP